MEDRLSDHSLISYEIAIGNIRRKNNGKWVMENGRIDNIIRELEGMREDIREAEDLQRVLGEAWRRNRSMVMNGEERGWWTRELNNNRNELNRKRRELARARGKQERSRLGVEFRSMRRVYKAKIKQVRTEHLRGLVEKDCDNPWDRGYRILRVDDEK